MKVLLYVLSIIALVFIILFFIVQVGAIESNETMSMKLQFIFGIGFLIISVCVLVFLIIVLFRKINVPDFIEVNFLEIFIAAIVIGVAALFLLFKNKGIY